MHFIKPAAGDISSPFGPRPRPGGIGSSLHAGTDIRCPVGSPVHASAAGVVHFAGLAGGYGGFIRLDHDDPHETYYAHLSYIGVRYGQHVAAGQVIGASGGRRGAWGAGTSTGPHLHTEHRINGTAVDPVPHWAGVASIDAEPIEEEDDMKLKYIRYRHPTQGDWYGVIGTINHSFGGRNGPADFAHFTTLWGAPGAPWPIVDVAKPEHFTAIMRVHGA